MVKKTTQGLWNKAWRSICNCCSMRSMRQSWPLEKSCRNGSWFGRNEFKKNPLCPSAQGPCYALDVQLALCWWILGCTAWRGFIWGNLGSMGRSVGTLSPEETRLCHGDAMEGRKDGITALPPHLLNPADHSFSFAPIISTFLCVKTSLTLVIIGAIAKICNYTPRHTFYKTPVQCYYKPLYIQLHIARKLFYSVI